MILEARDFSHVRFTINNYDQEYIDELEQKEHNRKLKYKNRDKKVKESFTLQDLLREEQRKQILKYMSE